MKSEGDKKAGRRKKRGKGARIWLSALLCMLFASFCYSAYKVADELITSKKEQDAFTKLSAIASEGRISLKSAGAEGLPGAEETAVADMRYDEKDDLTNETHDDVSGDAMEGTSSGDMAGAVDPIADENERGSEDNSDSGVDGNMEADASAEKTNGVTGESRRATGNDVLNATEKRNGEGSGGVSSDPALPYSPEERFPLPQYLPLYEINPDFFGWIYIEGTKIDYPVMYSPDRPEYYIRHAFDGAASNSGVPFVDGNCPADGNCYIVHGHHMKNQTMFGQLPLYAEQSYREEHPLIHFDTLYEQREYQVIAAFYSRVYDKGETGAFRYYEYTDLTDEEVFGEYVDRLRTAAIYDTGFEVSYGDELLVLSTCNYHVKDGRFVVVAKRNDI